MGFQEDPTKILSKKESEANADLESQEDTENSPEGFESFDAKEKKLRGEVSRELEELKGNINDLSNIAESKNMTPPLKEKVLESIDMISKKIAGKFEKIFAGIMVAGVSFGTAENLINAGKFVVEEGSILSTGNEVALGLVAVTACIEGIRFLAHKLKTGAIKKEVEKETLKGTRDAWLYMAQEGKKAGVDEDELPISRREKTNIYEEYIFAIQEDVNNGDKPLKILSSTKSKLLQ